MRKTVPFVLFLMALAVGWAWYLLRPEPCPSGRCASALDVPLEPSPSRGPAVGHGGLAPSTGTPLAGADSARPAPRPTPKTPPDPPKPAPDPPPKHPVA